MSDEPSAGGSRRWFVVAVALILIAGLAFAVGRFSTFGSQAAASSPGTDSPEAGFSRDMQVHHAQAIEMAMEIYRKTDDDELRVLSYDIATGQAGQRGEMFDWLVQWGLSQSGGRATVRVARGGGIHPLHHRSAGLGEPPPHEPVEHLAALAGLTGGDVV